MLANPALLRPLWTRQNEHRTVFSGEQDTGVPALNGCGAMGACKGCFVFVASYDVDKTAFVIFLLNLHEVKHGVMFRRKKTPKSRGWFLNTFSRLYVGFYTRRAHFFALRVTALR